MNTEKNDDLDIIQEIDIIRKMINPENIKEKESLLKKLNELEKIHSNPKNPIDLTKSAIISYICKYNPLNHSWNDKNIRQLGIKLVENYNSENIIDKCLNDIKSSFQKPSPFRAMISFNSNIFINNKSDNSLELYFKLLILNKDIQNIIKGINNVLNIRNEIIENQLKKLNFNNPYAIIFLRDLINELILKDKNIDGQNILENIKKNINNYTFFCPKCSEILYFSKNINIILLFCINKHYYQTNDIINLKNYIDINRKCQTCGKNIEIYEINYKCIQCKYFFCESCGKNHNKQNINHLLFDFYDVGYYCEKHYEKFSSYCAKCKKNLCKICLMYHFHQINPMNIYKIDKEKLEINKNKDLNNIKEIDSYIISRLSLIFSFMEDFSYTNLSIQLELWFNEEKNRKDIVGKYNFYFNKFFDKEFQNYYKKLIGNVMIGKEEAFNNLQAIQKEYEDLKIGSDISFNIFEKNAIRNNIKRDNKINSWIFEVKERLYQIEINNIKIMNKIKNIELKNDIKNLLNNISLIKIKIHSLFYTTNLYQSYLMKIVNRHLADLLIRKLIKKYPKKFNDIQLTFKNMYDTLAISKDFLLKRNNIESLNDLKDLINFDQSFIDLEDNEKYQKIEEFIKNILDNNKITFKEEISINNEVFSVDELNFVLEVFFFIKSNGNIIAHPNISIEKSISLKETKIIFSEINDKINKMKDCNSNINNNASSKDQKESLRGNIQNEIVELILQKMKKIKNEILNDFMSSIIQEKINLVDVINCIFKNEFNNIFLVNSSFALELSLDIDNLIQNYNYQINLSNNDEINDLIEEINDSIELIEENEEEYKSFKFELNDKSYQKLKEYIKQYFKNTLKKGDYGSNQYKKKILAYFKKNLVMEPFTDSEREALILSLLLPEIIDLTKNNLNKYENAFYNLVKNDFVFQNMIKILDEIYIKIDLYIKNRIKKMDLIQETKNFIISKKDGNSNLATLDITEERVIHIIRALIEDDDGNWIKTTDKTKVSYDPVLLKYQKIME